ncbi:MAG: dihydrofolate reductase [Hyphomicrobiales bacterium]|nr:dihydrofolate reductase [Hyphomicrobiales bacterium]
MPDRVRLPSISYIVARSYPGNVIGFRNQLPWRIKSDLKRFKTITAGHAIIMGRGTYDSIGRALPNRTNIVVSRTPRTTNASLLEVDETTQLYWANGTDDALFVADIVSILRGKDVIFVIGGAQMFEMFDRLVNHVYLTQVFGEFRGDAFFRKEFDKSKWKLLSEETRSKNQEGDGYSFGFYTYERHDKLYRYDLLQRFYTDKESKSDWLKRHLCKAKIDRNSIQQYAQSHLELEPNNH